MSIYISLLPASARLNVTSSAYSRSPPMGKPRASLVTRMSSGLTRRAIYMAVASPSKLGLVASRISLIGVMRLFGPCRVGRVRQALLNSLQQLSDLQIFRTDSFHRRNGPMQHMVDAVIVPRTLDGLDIQRLFDHADGPMIALCVIADATWIAVGDVVADPAEERICLEIFQCMGQIERNRLIAAQQEVGQPAGGFWPNAGQLRKTLRPDL